MKTSIFKIKLLNNKKIVRELEVAGEINLYRLAEAIVGAYDFDFDHAFGFFSKITSGWQLTESEEMYELFADLASQGIEPTGAKSVKKTKINEVWKNIGDKMLFLFDYGDDWRFVVELAGFGETQPKIKYPRMIKSTGVAPEQYPEVE